MSNETEQPKTQSLNPLEMNVNHTHIFQRHVTDTGKMLPRRITGLTAKHQRHISRQIKQARNLLLMQ
ncbi:MAG TPA: 30S ribosomal protein S18 [Opitutaceae bacterium]